MSPLASKASSPSFGRHPAALSNGMFSAFGRAAVPQSVMGAEPDGPPKVSSSGSTLKSGFLASTTKMVLPSFLETKASNSSSLATPPFLADMVTTDAPRRVDTDLALRSATRQKGIVVALARRACIASSSVIEFIPFAQVSRSGRFSSSRQHFCLTCFVVRKVVAFAWCESYERQLDIRILLDNKPRESDDFLLPSSIVRRSISGSDRTPRSHCSNRRDRGPTTEPWATTAARRSRGTADTFPVSARLQAPTPSQLGHSSHFPIATAQSKTRI